MSEHQRRQLLVMLLTLQLLACQAEIPVTNPTTPASVMPPHHLPEALRSKILQRSGHLLNVQVTPFSELQQKMQRKAVDDQTPPALQKHFGLMQTLPEVPCDSEQICHYQQAGDTAQYGAWESYYYSAYSTYGVPFFYHTNETYALEPLCVYEEREYCVQHDEGCLTAVNELILHGCGCPQNYNDSPLTYHEWPGACAVAPPADYICLSGTQNQTGSVHQSCIVCPPGQEVVYEGSTPVSCSPVSQSSTETKMFDFGIQSTATRDQPYYQLINNQCVRRADD